LGGTGSGSWYRFGTKRTVEEYYSLDVGVLNRKGLLKPGCSFTASWFGAGREVSSIAGIVLGEQRPELVMLLYTHGKGANAEGEHVRQPVELGWTPCNFGGERPWFLCPGIGCGGRVAVLHAAGKYFLCRHCYALSYESQRGDKAHRALRRAQKIRKRLGGSANMMEPFPEKPKGMHWSTYERLWQEHHEAEMEHLIGMREWIDKLEKKVG
jgi:hypothetical protein